ncbi:MAG: hypothetical protein ACFFG0_42675, partial [Candidatus Thorarchaeota archaeon]
ERWYHIRVSFDLNKGTSTLRLINKYDYDMNLISNIDNLNIFEISTIQINRDFSFYYDAIGYSWDNNYKIGDNLRI